MGATPPPVPRAARVEGRVMRRFSSWLVRLVRRPWRLAAVLALLGVCAAAGPPVWAWYHFRAGRRALERYHTATARAHLNACLRVWPDDAEAHLLAARAARRDDDAAAAESHLRACQRLAGSTPQTVLEWALLHASQGALDDVEGFLQAQAHKEPALAPLILEALAAGYLRVYRIVDALACLDAWLARRPDDVQALYLRGDVWRQVQAFPNALAEYRRAVELDPSREDARWWLAVCLVESARYDEALPLLERAAAARPGDPEVLVRLARCHQGLLDMDRARQLLDAVLAEHPDHTPALRARGQLAVATGRLDEAEDWLRRAAEAGPQDYRAQWALADCLKQRHKEAEALAQQARAERLKERLERLADISHRRMSATPHDPALHCDLGKLLIELGHEEVGHRWLLSALRLDPDFKPAHAALARYYEAQGDTGRADYHRRQAEAAPPSKPGG
jgi:tetratricopeptide (TPR) repeat protein